MEKLALALFFSIVTNVLTLRWGLREHSARCQWQNEAGALRQALRSVGTERVGAWSGARQAAAGLLILAAMVVLIASWAYIFIR